MHISPCISTTAHPGTCEHPHPGCSVTERTYQAAQLGTGGIASVSWWTCIDSGVYLREHAALPVVDGVVWLGSINANRTTAPSDIPIGVLSCLAEWLDSLGLKENAS